MQVSVIRDEYAARHSLWVGTHKPQPKLMGESVRNTVFLNNCCGGVLPKIPKDAFKTTAEQIVALCRCQNSVATLKPR